MTPKTIQLTILAAIGLIGICLSFSVVLLWMANQQLSERVRVIEDILSLTPE